MASQLVSVEGTATTTEASAGFVCGRIFFIKNDGTSDITFNFDAATSREGAITLKPGEGFADIPIRVRSTIYYVAASGTSPFRVWGMN